MALKKSQVKELTGLTGQEILLYLLKKELIIIKDKYNFIFKNEIDNDTYLLKVYSHGTQKTLWKHEAREFLISIVKECRELLQLKMKTSYVLPVNLPFIRGKKYIIHVQKCTTKTMLMETELGVFHTFKLGKRGLIQEGHRYTMVMNEKNTILEEINDL
ncbi:MAG: hypothetical protein JJW00_01225 [Sulfurimonas sp.]|nr:hypothetical protein [Sulfurimonas sp.]